jgi:hypothetical protein
MILWYQYASETLNYAKKFLELQLYRIQSSVRGPARTDSV